MEYVQMILAICGAVAVIGGAGAVIAKVIRPALQINKRVTDLEARSEKDYRRILEIQEMQKAQTRCLVALLNHQITGNGIESMKKIRDELMESIID